MLMQSYLSFVANSLKYSAPIFVPIPRGKKYTILPWSRNFRWSVKRILNCSFSSAEVLAATDAAVAEKLREFAIVDTFEEGAGAKRFAALRSMIFKNFAFKEEKLI